MAVSLNHAARGGVAPPQGGVSIVSLRDGIKLLTNTPLSGTVAEVHVLDDSNQVLLVGGGERVRDVTVRNAKTLFARFPLQPAFKPSEVRLLDVSSGEYIMSLEFPSTVARAVVNAA